MNVAIIGTGYIAHRHAEALSTMDGVTITAHLDVDLASAAAAAQRWGGSGYDSLDSLLQTHDIDAAWVCVPPFAHGEIETTLAKHSVAMYIEKPVGTDIVQPAELLALFQERRSVVNVGYYWRCLEVIKELQTMLKDTPPQLVRIAYHGPTAPAPWWQVQSKSGGQVVEQATHLIDIARYLVGDAEVLSGTSKFLRRPEYPDMDIATSTTALLTFAGAVPGIFSATCVLDTFVDTKIEFLCQSRKLTLSLKELTVEDSTGSTVIATGEDPLVIADRRFIQAVLNSDITLLPCSYEDAFKTQQLCYEIYLKSLEAKL